MDPSVWEIGPIINGRNYSVGMPLNPSAHPNGGWYFDIPYPTAAEGHAHYVTFPHGTLTGKSRITMRYRLEMDPDVQLVPTKEQPGVPSILTMYFQRAGDNWSATGLLKLLKLRKPVRSARPYRAISAIRADFDRHKSRGGDSQGAESLIHNAGWDMEASMHGSVSLDGFAHAAFGRD
jgi:hypothetical protein